MENSQHVKSVSTDSRSKNRIRYASSRQRAKRASADVYRSYKRSIGVTSAASREERVHNPGKEESERKRRRTKATDFDDSKVAIVKGNATVDIEENFAETELDSNATFSSELDLAHDRNASEIFGQFYREIWPLARSLPEVLHHAPEIIRILMTYILSLESVPSVRSPGTYSVDDGVNITADRENYIANHATTDILHLLSVLARDLRHEIHPYVHTLIVPRILYDLLNPPPPPVESGRQPAPLNVTIVESAFRTLSYVFRYDSESLVTEVEKDGQEPCLEKMRKYYGISLGHKRDYVRRLSAETFAPLVRKLKSDNSKRHLKRVIKALAASVSVTEGTKYSQSQKRAQSDAVDGIAFLLFQIARGVPGRLHSKGNLIVRCVLDCMVEKDSKKKKQGRHAGADGIIREVASQFMEKTCRHLEKNNFGGVWKEILKAAEETTSSVVQITKSKEVKGGQNIDQNTSFNSLNSILLILDQCIAFRDGLFLKGSKDDSYINKISGLLKSLLDVKVCLRMPESSRNNTMKLLCTLWKVFQNRPGFASTLSQYLPAILNVKSKQETEGKLNGKSSTPAQILAQNLLPYLPREHTMKYIGTVLLSAVAGVAEKDPAGSRVLLYSLASAEDAANTESISEDDNDKLFNVTSASSSMVLSEEKLTLLDLCLVDIGSESQQVTRDSLAQLGYCCRSIPFVALLGVKDSDEKKESLSTFKKLAKWNQSTLKILDRAFKEDPLICDSKVVETDLITAKALLVECFATLSVAYYNRLKDTTILQKNVTRLQQSVVNLLLTYPASIWSVKCGASFVEALQLFDLQLNDTPDDMFESLTPNLRSESHFLRLHTLQILDSYQKKPFITDHADLDLADDLDEEPSTHPNAETSDGQSSKRSPTGPCDIITTLVQLESTPIQFKNERALTSLLTRVEVLGRTGKLPVAYAEASANHLLGILNTKFSPIWQAAVKAQIALANGHEDCVWPALEVMLKQVIIPRSSNEKPEFAVKASEELLKLIDSNEHHSRCVAWDSSSGADPSIFGGNALVAERDGRVSRHQCTDLATKCELVWSIMEGLPQLTASKSRTIVPIFLGFLQTQYYLFHENDPDAREFRLEEHLDEEEVSWVREDLHRKMLQKKLYLFLKMFSSVNGPQQLHKHPLLLSIFSAFLSHQDASIAQLSLTCVLKFKLPHIMPYSEQLKAMLKKGELRETLIKFDISKKSGIVDQDHRSQLIPLISRILFGRLTARVSGGKSSKDTPTARRAAVLSFLSVLGGNICELDPFVYLMIRSFIPAGHTLKPAEKRTKEDQEELAAAIKSIKADDVSKLTRKRQEGFLNLLSDVITQLGYGVQNHLSTFMSIILALLEYTGVEEKCGGDLVEDKEEDEETVYQESSQSRIRFGVVRTLCFRRLADLLEQFATSSDFTIFEDRLWNAIAPSIRMLPGTAVNADKSPSLLIMLLRISSHQELLPLLSKHPQAIESVIRCISKTSKAAIIDASLKFVDNLLTNGDSDVDGPLLADVNTDAIGMRLIQQYVPLLMEQFTLRLESAGDTADATSTQLIKRKQPLKSQGMSQTTRRELAILCRVSELLVRNSGEQLELNNGMAASSDVLGSLCKLLVPFLSPDQKASEDDLLNVLGILNSIFPKVLKETALSQLPEISRILGPFKSRSGIASLNVRQQLASVVKTLSNMCDEHDNLRSVAEVLWKICAINSKRVDEVDYDELIPALSALGDKNHVDSGWFKLSGCDSEYEHSNVGALAPLIFTCFHLLFDDDGVVSRGAQKALKTLVNTAAEQAILELGRDVSSEEIARQNQWVILVEKTLVPCIRSGLNANNSAIRRYYLLLLAEVAKCFRDFSAPNLYGDLSCLINSDDPDLDFFMNITHVQIHRRARGLQRLRKVLNRDSDLVEENGPSLTMHSLSNVLLPVTLHPIYECKTKAEEPYALEAIATAGAIAKHLSWSKYHNSLWTVLNQFPHHPEQERYLIGVICSLIDAFHFQVIEENSIEAESISDELESESKVSPPEQGSAVWRALEKRIIPKVESYLVKEKVDRKGSKIKTLRSAVVLALFKLFQKFPVQLFEAKLPRLFAVICDALKSSDSDARDVARATLAKMCSEMEMKYLSYAIRELAITLTEGYRLHVRMATLHSILLELSKKYRAPSKPNDQSMLSLPLPFDQTVPAIMDLVQQDLFGDAKEWKDAEGVQKRLVKEASGSKSMDSIELICRMIFFQPSSLARPCSNGRKPPISAIHAVVSPLLERLRNPDVSSSIIGRIRECLNRVVVGISHNPSVEQDEVFPFIYASVAPFVGANLEALGRRGQSNDDEMDSSDDEDELKPINISKSNQKGESGGKVEQKNDLQKKTASNVVEWRPSTLNAANSATEARGMKSKERQALKKVQDGASAPKLTGSSRYETIATSTNSGLNNPAGISAVVFGLSLFYSILKKTKRDANDTSIIAMLDPFIPMLTTCVNVSRDNDVVLLSLRCLGVLLRTNLPSVPSCAKTLGTKTLDLLTSAGSLSNLHHELTLGCFRTLALLFGMGKSFIEGESNRTIDKSEQEFTSFSSKPMPLDSEQMEVLISMLKVAIVDSDSHNATLGLVKAIASRRFISPEFYDLMETLLQLSVRSQKQTVRQQCSVIFMQYLIDYPMAKQRLEGHMKQIILNVKYEYEDGRLSALGLVNAVIDKLPTSLLEDHAQLFFLPLVLQLVNDDSKDCREAAAKSLSRLLNRVSIDVLQSFYDYTVRWSESSGPLQQTSLQVFGVFVDARVDFLKRGNMAIELIERMQMHLSRSSSDGQVDDWEGAYFSLVCLEKVAVPFDTIFAKQSDVWMEIVKSLCHPHPWVKQVSSRMVAAHLSTLDPATFPDNSECTFLLERHGALFEIAKNLCSLLNVDESEQNEDLTKCAIKSLTWAIQAMHEYPHLCFANESSGEEESEEEGRSDVRKKNPVGWLMTRLSNIAKPKGDKRREAIYKCFAAFATYGGPSILSPYLELMLEPLHRSIVETANKAVYNTNKSRRPADPVEEKADLAKDVMQLLEESCGTEAFLEAYASVKTKAREKREQRKQLIATEAVQDPQAAAARKIKKHQNERNRRKRKVADRRAQRGGKIKRRHLD